MRAGGLPCVLLVPRQARAIHFTAAESLPPAQGVCALVCCFACMVPCLAERIVTESPVSIALALPHARVSQRAILLNCCRIPPPKPAEMPPPADQPICLCSLVAGVLARPIQP